MVSASDSNSFFQSAANYEKFMGRYARPLAKQFVTTIPLSPEQSVLEIGCGPGALTAELVEAVGSDSVSVIDPSPPFLHYCVQQNPGIRAEIAPAEQIPFADHEFDAVYSQLVIHFIGNLPQAGREIMRVLSPGGSVAVCTWNLQMMEKINLLPRATRAAGIEVPPLPVQEFMESGSVARYLESIGLANVEESTLDVSSTYSDFDELWEAYLLSIGPMGPWALARSDQEKQRIRDAMYRILDSPADEITLHAQARVAVGTSPSTS